MKKPQPFRQKPAEILSRYTSLPVLLDLIERQSLVFLNPQSWQDRNDSLVMEEYKKRRKLTCLLALCFSKGDETIHHWNTFAGGPSGCRIDFHMPSLIDQLKDQDGIRYDKVSYRKMHGVKAADLKEDNMPFIKRWPYRIEEEFRLLYESTNPAEKERSELVVPIEMNSIRSITVSQSMPETVFASIKSQLGAKLGKRISRSTLLENRTWINRFQR
jgi:hypothetical protein